jgi:hypothetical protein
MVVGFIAAIVIVVIAVLVGALIIELKR